MPFTPREACRYVVWSGSSPCASDHGSQRIHQTNWYESLEVQPAVAVVSFGSRRWCRAREQTRYAAAVSATARRGSPRTGAPSPAADLTAALAHAAGTDVATPSP